MSKLAKSFYTRSNALLISRELLGKFLFANINGELTGGMIVETEAYMGPEDKACHAHLNRRTKRTEIMFSEGGVAYVYLCYGIHALFNIVTAPEGTPHACLVRAIEPTVGLEVMLKRRNKEQVLPSLTAGPGALTQALGIECKHYGTDLTGDTIWIEDHGIAVSSDKIIASSRVGIAYAEEHIDLPWRFRVKDNKWVSKAK
ncbi:MAG: DNA-3-methyladenine glycosylase [Candidatus Caenarcaniphilales bacterium]|nr:DNA-3-methyladenine glycosylase [Candidatus Caenarcaniphilales bacterium]